MNHPTRRSIRLPDYDYSQNGAYFVTLCAWQRNQIFGKINAGEMELNDCGKIAEKEWLSTCQAFSNTSMDVFMVMPNHLHGIIFIDHPGTIRTGARIEVPERKGGTARGSIAAIIAQFKSRVTKRILAGGRNLVIQGQIWQRNYYEHIIRNETEWERIRKYIETNPMNWDVDDENPDRPQPDSKAMEESASVGICGFMRPNPGGVGEHEVDAR